MLKSPSAKSLGVTEDELERAIENIKKCNRINPKNKEPMLKFIELRGTSAGRYAKILWTLKKFAIGLYERRGHRSKEFNGGKASIS